MQSVAHRRHDIFDVVWGKLEQLLPGREGAWGGACNSAKEEQKRTARVRQGAFYKTRHSVENAFLHLKRWRGIATRYAKNTASFLAAIHIRCLFLWASIS